MAAPIIPALPDAPNRGTGQADFSDDADLWVADLPPWTVAANSLGTWMNDTAVTVQSNTDAAAASAAAAAASETAAASSANFQGLWTDQTGAAVVPYSVYHSNRIWNLINNVADVTASEPGISADWVTETKTAARNIFLSTNFI